MKTPSHYLSKSYLTNQLRTRILFPLRITDLIDYVQIRRKNSLIPVRRLIWGGPSRSSLAFYKWGIGDLNLFIEHANLMSNSGLVNKL